MSKQDYYNLLGVNKDASQADIKKAYRRLAMKHHPDRNPDDKEADKKFKEIQEAYAILSDQQKRTAYDQFGHAGVDQSAAGGFSAGGGFGDVFGDIFGDIFGAGQAQRGGRRGAARGSDLKYNLDISLEDAVRGTTVKIRVPTLSACSLCEGSGAKKGTSPTQCTSCNGSGNVRMQQGFFVIEQSCPRCHGVGQMIESPCEQCNGQGRVREHKTLNVKIPAGIDTGNRIRLAGEGEAGALGAPTGDLYVQVSVREHSIFTRDGSHLYCEIPISFATAVLGGELEVPTLAGKIMLKIPAETQTGKLFRIRGKGIKSLQGRGIGDLLCRVIVETPVNLTKAQRQTLSEFDSSIEKNKKAHSPKSRSWFAGVKKFFEELRS